MQKNTYSTDYCGVKATSPRNLLKDENTAECKVDCALQCAYPKIPLYTLTNQGDHLLIKFTASAAAPAPVQYNKNSYQVEEVRLYQPSLHTYFAGYERAKGELIIIHTSVEATTKSNLLICVPIMPDGSNTGSLKQFDPLITKAAKQVPSGAGKTGGAVIQGELDLNQFVPKKPFFVYNGTGPFLGMCEENTILALELEGGAIAISPAALLNLQKIIAPANYPLAKNGGLLFYTKNSRLLGGNDGDGGGSGGTSTTIKNCKLKTTGETDQPFAVDLNDWAKKDTMPDNSLAFIAIGSVMCVIMLGAIGGIIYKVSKASPQPN